MWVKQDDGAWRNAKLRRVGRAARGLYWDLTSFAGDSKGDGWIEDISLPQIETSTTDPDLRRLVREGLVHKAGDRCRCIDRRGFTWPRGRRGYLLHDWLDYNPSREENEVKVAQTAELRDPSLRAAVRARDFGRCRYCGNPASPMDKRGPSGETLDHVDPAIAAGADNLVIACRSCNSAKKKRTPAEALMVLLEVADVRAKHYADLGQPDPDLAPIAKSTSNPIQVGQADGPGRVGSGSGRDGIGSGRDRVGSDRVGSDRVGSGPAVQTGPPSTVRDSVNPNPYTRSGHGDPSLEPPPPEPHTNSPPARAAPRSQRPLKRKKGRR